AALMHLAPLRGGTEAIGLDLSAWRQRLDTDLRGFFLMVQALRPDLEAAAQEGGAAVIGATRMGGAFGSDGTASDFFAGHGGLTGFLKALATEYTSVRVKAVDFGPEAPARIAARLLAE